MEKTEVFLNNMINEIGEFVQKNPKIRGIDGNKIEEFFFRIHARIAVELVKRDIIEEDLTKSVVAYIENLYLPYLNNEE